MKRSLKEIYNESMTTLRENKHYQKSIDLATNTSTFKRTLFLAIFYVFLFYFPFTFLSLVFNQGVFFQLDYTYQFATIIFDFREKVMHLNLSSWDWKNSFGYDYFANFYYIPLDFSLLPYFLFPFLSFSNQMWLSFLLKALVGTGVFSYLLKLYKLNHKTILFTSIIYGSASLFFDWNVFPSFTGLIVYIPLILVAIELMVQKRLFWVFSLVIFQTILFNFYWAWSLTMFMTLALLCRTLYHFLHVKTFYHPKTWLNILRFLATAFGFYLLGVGLSAFFLGPVLNIMQNEPRMEGSGFSITDLLNVKALFSHNLSYYTQLIQNYIKTHPEALSFNKMVYYKTALKQLIPNLFLYSGYYKDPTNPLTFYASNMNIIYSSVMASFTLFQFLFYPTFMVRKKLNAEQFKNYVTLKLVTIITTALMMFPIISYAFSLTPIPYIRWFIYFGVLLIINLAFLIEYHIFNKHLFLIYLLISIAFLFYSIRFNVLLKVASLDESIIYFFIVAYSIIVVFLLIFEKVRFHNVVLLIEKIALAGAIYVFMVTPFYTSIVNHADTYGKAVNSMMEDVTLNESYYTTIDMLYLQDDTDLKNMQNASYLFDFPIYNNQNIFHTLINPYFTFQQNNAIHSRGYMELYMPYMYYLYLDPSLYILSNTENYPIYSGFQDPSSTLIATKEFPQFNSNIQIYEKQANFSLGSGFTEYYQVSSHALNYNYKFLDAFYVEDQTLMDHLIANGFTEEDSNVQLSMHRININTSEIEPYAFPNYQGVTFYQIPVNVTKEDSNVIVLSSSSNGLFSIDGNGQINKCYNTFCFVPDSGITSLISSTKYGFYTMDKDLMQQKIELLKSRSTYDVTINGNDIKAKINNNTPLIMTFKMGYATGWDAYVDGQKVETFAGQMGQLSFILNTTGEQTIHLVYHTPNLNSGIKLSIITFFVLGGIIAFDLYRRKQYQKLHQYVVKHKLQEFIRFVGVGVLATLISYLIYRLFLQWMNENFAYTIGYALSFIFNFFATNLFTFKTKANVPNGLRFGLAHLTNYIIQILLLNFFIIIQIPKTFAPLPVYVLAIPINFYVVRFALKYKKHPIS